jgi:hypothetical protein
MARTAKDDIEKRFYDVFSGWTRADREIALRVMTELHKRLPEPKKGKADAEPQGSLLTS